MSLPSAFTICNIPVGFACAFSSCGKPIGFLHLSGLFSSSYCFLWQAQDLFQSWIRSQQIRFSFLSVPLLGTGTCGMWDVSSNAHRSWDHTPRHEVLRTGMLGCLTHMLKQWTEFQSGIFPLLPEGYHRPEMIPRRQGSCRPPFWGKR